MTENIYKENIKIIDHFDNVKFIYLPYSTKDSFDIENIKPKIIRFFKNIIKNGDNKLFFPHGFLEEDVENIINYQGKDIYAFLYNKSDIIAYGMLRGWDEGYDIPSLGICVDKRYRGRGISKKFMELLHNLAASRKAEKVRLTVLKNNEIAISLYKSVGYVLSENERNDSFVGFKKL